MLTKDVCCCVEYYEGRRDVIVQEMSKLTCAGDSYAVGKRAKLYNLLQCFA